MKNSALIFVLTIVANCSIAQNAAAILNDPAMNAPCYPISSGDTTYRIVDQMPEYLGGNQELFTFIAKNIRYPSFGGCISGKVYVEFVVSKEGTPCDFKVVRGIGAGADEEAIRVLKMMKRWQPGQHEGKLVNVRYTIPISFTIE